MDLYIRSFEGEGLPAETTRYISTVDDEMTPKMETYLRTTSIATRDKWDLGKISGFSGESKMSFLTYAWNYQRSTDRHCCTTVFFLRADDFMEDIFVKPDLTLTELFQSLGGSWAFVGITIALVARAGNLFTLDKASRERTVNSYIQAVAWGDIEMANRLGMSLRGELLGARDNTQEIHTMYETINYFRKHVEAASGAGVSLSPFPRADSSRALSEEAEEQDNLAQSSSARGDFV